MLKKLAQAALIAVLAIPVSAVADDRREPKDLVAPQALSDSELDAITAGGVTVVVSNPGKGQVFNIQHGNFICVSCGGPSDTTNGLIITPSGKFIVIPGGPNP